ncbi:TRAP transporter substrate-binding protein [Hyphococcus formosus]|uniref:TRAP transporter substrate-binding protein n=1 Tax=Hyphococcus formosus TaxID=3143534 RepID=UPI00398AAE1F
MIKRRQLLSAGALGGAGLLAGCECGVPTNGGNIPGSLRSRELKMVTTWPKDFPGLGTMAERTAQFITEMSGGAMTVRVFSAGELVGAFESFDAVSNGAADLYHGAEYYWVGKSPAFAFFTAVPFGMTANEIMAWTEFGGGQELWDELAAPFNIKPFAAGNTGHQMAGWYKREINSVEDLRGMKIRMPGLGGDVIQRLGAAAVALSGGEIYQALQSGGIDGTEWVGPWNDLAFGFYREAKYYYWPGFHEPGAQLSVGVNLDIWDELTLQERSIIEGACHRANHLSIAEYIHHNATALDQLVNEHGVQLRQMPDDVMAALARESKIVLEETAQVSDIAKRIFESYKTSLERSQAWSRISDEAYMNIRRNVFSL